MNLREARIGKRRAVFVCAPDGGAVGAAGVSRKMINVTVATGSEHHGVGRVRFDLARDQVARDDAACLAVDHYQAQHFGAREHLHFSRRHLPFERLVRS